MDRDTQAHYFNRCNPDEPLDPGDERNVEIDAQRGSAEQPRGTNWVDKLARSVELSDQPVCEFFTGLPGSGKSTELRRLAARLRAGGWLPVIVDAEDVLDVFSRIDVADVVVMTLYSIEQAVLREEGLDRDEARRRALRDGYLARIRHWIGNTGVELKSLGVGAPGVAPVEAGAELEFKTQPTFREKARQRISAHLTTFLQHARDEARALEQRARRRGHPRGLAVIVDSLEKLRGTSTTWTEVLGSAEQVFAGDAPSLRLGVHTVYTVPPALAQRLKISVLYMPMLKLADPATRSAYAPGVEAARRIVRQRLPDEVLRQIFGAAFEARVAELLRASGGYPREIVRLLKACVAQAPLSEPLFRRLLVEAGDEYRRTIPKDALELLADVSLTKTLLPREDQRAIVDLIVSNNVVLRYRNDHEWFDLHPALHGFEPLEQVIAARRAAAAAGSGSG